MIDFHCHITTENSHFPSADGEYYHTLRPIAESGAWMDMVWAETIESLAENWRSGPMLKGYRQMSPLIYSEMMRRMMHTDANRLTLEMAYNHVRQAVVVAVDPFIPTNEIVAACARTKDILLPFGSVAPWSQSWRDDLAKNLNLPIAGFKFHGDLQQLGFGSPRMREILTVLTESGFDKPIFVHTGEYPVYKPQKEDWAKELGILVADFPNLKFVCGHSGWNRPSAAYRIAKHHPNFWLETSWQPPRILRRLCALLGANRFVLGSDYPLHSMRRAIRNCRIALSVRDFEIVSEEVPRKLLSNAPTLALSGAANAH